MSNLTNILPTSCWNKPSCLLKSQLINSFQIICLYAITRWLWNLTEYGMCMINDVSTVLGSLVPVSQKTCVFSRVCTNCMLQLTERISYIQETLYGRVCKWKYRIMLIIHGEKLAVPHLYLHSQKNVHGYQRLQAFVVFMCKNSPKNFCSAK